MVLFDPGLGLFGTFAVHHKQVGVAHDFFGQIGQHLDGDNEAQVTRRRGVILPRPDSLKNRGTVRHGDAAVGVFAKVRLTVIHRDYAGLDLLHQGGESGFVSLFGIKALGVDELGQLGIKIVRRELIFCLLYTSDAADE